MNPTPPPGIFRRFSRAWQTAGLVICGLLMWEVGSRIVAPTINAPALADALRLGSSSLFKLYDWFVGGALSRGAVLGLGIMPYVTARIIMRLGRIVSPEVEQLDQTDAGQLRLTRWTRGLTFSLALIQSYGFATFIQTLPGVAVTPGPGFVAQTMLTLTAGAMGVTWLSERMSAILASDEPMDTVDEARAADTIEGGADMRSLPAPDLPESVRQPADTREARKVR